MMKCILYGFTFAALSISVTAQDMLSVNATQTRYSVTVGNTVVLNCNVYGTATSVHWYFQYQLLNTTDSRFTNGNLQIPSLTISGVRSSDDGFYYCQDRNSATDTTVNTDTIILEVLTGTGGSVPHSVTINLPSDSITITQGQTVSVTCDSHGSQPITYIWYTNDASTPVENKASITISESNPGTYRYVCRATNIYGFAEKDITVHIQPLQTRPLTISITPPNVAVEENTEYTLTCQADGYPEPTYQWSKDGTVISNGATLYVPSALYTTNNGIHTCNATNKLGSIVQNANVDVHSAPSTINISHANVNVQQGNSFSLTCVANGNPTPTYKWYYKGNWIHTGSNLIVNNALYDNNHGSYTCNATNSEGYKQKSVEVNVQYIRSLVTQTSIQASVGNPVTLICDTEANPPGTTRSWRYNSGNVIGSTDRELRVDMDTANDAGVYTCTATNAIGQSVVIDFTVSIENGSPLGPSTITITPLNTVVQQGNSYTLTCNANGNPVPTYQWFRNGVELNPGKVLTVSSASNSIHHGTHICKATNDYGSIQSSANVNVQYIPESSVLQNSVTGIVGNPLNLTCSTTANPPAIAWEWKYNGNDLTHTGKILTVDMDTTNDIGTYTCRATNQVGTSNDITFTVIDGTPPATGATIVDTGLTAGEIAAIILGLLFGLLLLLALLIFCCCPQACAGCCGGCGRRNDQKVEPEGKPSKIITYYEQPDDYVINYRTLEIPRFHEVSDRQPSAEYEINKYTVLKPDYNNRLEATFIPTTDPETDNTYMSSNNSRQYIIPNEENKEERRRRRRRRRKKRSRDDNYSDDHLRDNEIVIEERILNGDVRHSSIRTSDGDVHMRSSDYYLYT